MYTGFFQSWSFDSPNDWSLFTPEKGHVIKHPKGSRFMCVCSCDIHPRSKASSVQLTFQPWGSSKNLGMKLARSHQSGPGEGERLPDWPKGAVLATNSERHSDQPLKNPREKPWHGGFGLPFLFAVFCYMFAKVPKQIKEISGGWLRSNWVDIRFGKGFWTGETTFSHPTTKGFTTPTTRVLFIAEVFGVTNLWVRNAAGHILVPLRATAFGSRVAWKQPGGPHQISSHFQYRRVGVVWGDKI